MNNHAFYHVFEMMMTRPFPFSVSLMRPLSRLVFAVMVMAVVAFTHVPSVSAQSSGMTIIRDVEIETTLKTWLAPLLKAAQMKPEQVNLVLVGSDQINAFVAGGSNIFLFTGLILEAENAAEVTGVMAHELGHIQGGHLVRGRAELEKASYQSILATVLGIGVGVAGGGGEAATAISMGGSSVAARNFLSFSRTQESSADQAALRYFNAAGFSPQGLVSFMEKLEGQELLPSTSQTEYMRTHPMTRERVAAMRAGYDRSAHQSVTLPPQWQEQFDRMKAKITAFQDPARAIGVYGGDNSVKGQYAMAVADYRQGRMDSALAKMDKLIAAEPNNPYFYEFKGQILLEAARMAEAIVAYRKALSILPDAGLIRIDLARAMVEVAGYDNKAMLNEAQAELKRAQTTEKKSSGVYRLLATIYGRLGDEAKAQIELAEESSALGNYDEARRFAALAKASLEKQGRQGTGDWIHVQDVLQYIDNKKDTR